MLRFEYLEQSREALLIWDNDPPRWVNLICQICLAASESAQRVGGNKLTVPWWSFLALRDDVNEVISHYDLRQDKDFSVSEDILNLLTQAKYRQTSFVEESQRELSPSEIQTALAKQGFVRELTKEQLRNVAKLTSRNCGATFSVPGAGKTTEALATFALNAEANDRLLVIAPKNAFAAWDEQVEACLPNLGGCFVRLRKTESIYGQLLADPKLAIIGFQQFVRVRELIAEYLGRNSVHVYVDESHRIKGLTNQTTQSILSISHLPKGKLIMSGTPMPQSATDLISQFNFLFPEIKTDSDDVIEKITKIYVRTNKSELNLPPITRRLIKVDMDAEQAHLYRLLKSEVAREAEQALKEQTKFALRRFGKSVTSLLQFVSNPALLAAKPEFKFAEELANTLSKGDGPKIRRLVERVREVTKKGEKVLIWTSFVKNVEYLAEALEDLGAVYIHGGVDAGSDDDEDTREGKIKKFHDDPNTQVLIANPAAASEGISLHKVCHHAIYLDRNFNAAQYLQSEDRIHRLGLAQDQQTFLEIIECIGTVDETVRVRLEHKIDRMAAVLGDSELSVTPLAFIDDVEHGDVSTIDLEDLEAILSDLR